MIFDAIINPTEWLSKNNFLLLFPLNRARRLGCDIVDHSVDTFDFIADSSAHFVKDFPGESEVVGGHTVGACDSSDTYGVIVCSFITHDAYAADRGRKYGKGLPDFVIESSFFNDFSDNGIRFTEDIQSFRGNFTDDTDCQS